MKELRAHAEKNNLSVAQLMMANETTISGKSEAEVNAFLDKIMNAMVATVKVGLTFKNDVLPGPIKLHSKASTVFERAQAPEFTNADSKAFAADLKDQLACHGVEDVVVGSDVKVASASVCRHLDNVYPCMV